MTPYFVYILECSDASFYTGVSNDLERRVFEHNSGFDSKAYTYRRRPVKLVFYEDFHDINQAIDFEKQVKGWSRQKKKALIIRNWDKIVEYSKCRNDSSHENLKS